MKLIAFEGMWMGKDAYTCAMLRSIGIDNFSGHGCHEKVEHPGARTVWFGHSLGGHTALEHARPGDAVFTFDPRQKSVGSWFDSIFRYPMPFTEPKDVTVFNFYRRGLLLPGQEVKGAENIKLSAWVTHPGVPKAAASTVERLLKEMGIK